MRNYFEFKKNNTDFRTEAIAGTSTFLAAMYIIVVNPVILSNSGMDFSGVLTATVLICAFSSIMMGFYAKNPIVVAPGMGLNAFFTYSVVLGMGIEWEVALGAVFWSGVIFLLMSIFRIRVKIVSAIPKTIRHAVAAGIGLFIALIGFINAKFVVADPFTLLQFGGLNVVTATFVLGLILTAVLVVLRIQAGILLGIVGTTLLSIPVGRLWGDAAAFVGSGTLVAWQGLFAAPDFSLIFKADLIGSLGLSIWPVIFAFLFVDLFDSLSTFVGVAEAADLLDDKGEPRNIRESLIVDGLSTAVSGLLGSSPGTSYIESAVGIEQGGRTGLTAIVAGLWFLPFMFFSPLLSVVPAVATAPALVLVGAYMMRPAAKINWSAFDEAIPAFVAMLLIPATYSITQGIIWGFLTWTVVKWATGKRAEITPTLLIIDLFAILSLVM